MKLILLSYINRSGSTYLANLLSGFRQICVCPEADILYDLFLKHPDKKISIQKLSVWNDCLMNDTKFQSWKITRINWPAGSFTGMDAFIAVLNQFRTQYYSQSEYLLFKHNKLFKLFRQLPDRKDIDIYWLDLLRDPLGIYASQKHTISPSTRKAMSQNPYETIDSWNEFISVIRSPNGGNRHTLTYESLLKEGDECLNKIFNWLCINDRYTTEKELFKWLTDEYRTIHLLVNNEPKPDSITQWKVKLNNFEKFAIQANRITTPFYPEPVSERRPRGYWFYWLIMHISKKFRYLKAKARERLIHSDK